jgi:hypothetical protein
MKRTEIYFPGQPGVVTSLEGWDLLPATWGTTIVLDDQRTQWPGQEAERKRVKIVRRTLDLRTGVLSIVVDPEKP